jgi:hypothetical protein
VRLLQHIEAVSACFNRAPDHFSVRNTRQPHTLYHSRQYSLNYVAVTATILMAKMRTRILRAANGGMLRHDPHNLSTSRQSILLSALSSMNTWPQAVKFYVLGEHAAILDEQ